MNCKPGDTARRVRAPDGSGIPVGSVVICSHYVSEFANVFVGSTGKTRRVHGSWRVEYNGSHINKEGYLWAIRDEDLRPIRGECEFD